MVAGFPKDCNPALEREAARDALTSHIQSIVVANYGKLSAELKL